MVLELEYQSHVDLIADGRFEYVMAILLFILNPNILHKQKKQSLELFCYSLQTIGTPNGKDEQSPLYGCLKIFGASFKHYMRSEIFLLIS